MRTPSALAARPGRGRSRRGGAAVDTAKVREWTKGQGIAVKDHGRVPANVVEQYKTATRAWQPQWCPQNRGQVRKVGYRAVRRRQRCRGRA